MKTVTDQEMRNALLEASRFVDQLNQRPLPPKPGFFKRVWNWWTDTKPPRIKL